MRDDLGLLFGTILLLTGLMLLYNSVSSTDANQSFAILGGAALLSLGAMLVWTVLKNWWGWRKEYRKERNG